MPKNHGIKPEK